MRPKAEIGEGRCRLSIRDCRPQKARIKMGLGELACKSPGLAYFEGYAPAIDDRLRYRCLLCPPDLHAEDLWCQWELWLEESPP